MIDPSVTDFFSKNVGSDYAAQYRRDHQPRLKAMLNRFSLTEMKDKKVLDVGGGLGFLGELLDSSNEYFVADGAEIAGEQRLCKGMWFQIDLDRDLFGSSSLTQQMDVAFCCETLEHLGNPFNCLNELKKIVKRNGDIYISIPTEQMWHNAPYPGLLWPVQNFEQFLGQMALPILDRWTWTTGWPSYHFRCCNAGYEEKVMLFHKTEEKFRYANPLEMTNL